VKSLLNDADVNAKLDKVESHASSVGKSVGSAFTGMKLAFGAVGLMAADYLKGSIESASKAQKANSDLEATIKSTGGAAGMTAKEVGDMASALSKVSLFGGTAIKTGEAMLLTFTNIGKDVLPGASQAMLDLAQKFGGEPVDQAVKLGKALNDPINGLTALTRVGVTFTDEQKNQVKAMQESGNVAGAQKLILSELNKEFGGQALAATKTYDGQMQMMTKSMAGVKTSIGTAVLPYLQKMVDGLQSVVTPVTAFIQNNSKLAAGILTVTAGLGLFIGGASVLHTVLGVLGPVASGLGTTIAGMMLPVTLIIAGIAALGYAYSTNFLGMGDVVNGFVDGAWKILSDVFTEVKDWVISNLPAIQETFQTVFDAVTEVAQSVFDFYSGIFLPLFETVHQWFLDHMPEIKDAVTVAFTKVVAVATTLYNYFKDNILPTIMSLVDDIKVHMPEIQRIFQTVFSIIGNVLNIAWAVIKKVWDIMVSLYDFVSPTFPTIGKIIKAAFDIVIGVVKGTIDVFITLVDWITTAVEWLTKWEQYTG